MVCAIALGQEMNDNVSRSYQVVINIIVAKVSLPNIATSFIVRISKVTKGYNFIFREAVKITRVDACNRHNAPHYQEYNEHNNVLKYL